MPLIIGSKAADALGGTRDDDTMGGGPGNDTLFGEGGDDVMDGGSGDDHLTGNAGADTLTGGFGRDVFSYATAGTSNADLASADRITDFNAADDSIDMPVSGGDPNWPWYYRRYEEVEVADGGGFEVARAAADDIFTDGPHDWNTSDPTYVFVTDGVDGYLFTDGDKSGTAEGAIILEGLPSLDHFSALDIV
jgi:Ca2+-binding RTX toxin-like protein